MSFRSLLWICFQNDRPSQQDPHLRASLRAYVLYHDARSAASDSKNVLDVQCITLLPKNHFYVMDVILFQSCEIFFTFILEVEELKTTHLSELVYVRGHFCVKNSEQ